MRRYLLLGTFLALFCTLPSSSWAQDKAGDDQRSVQAEQLDQRARTAYRLGEFDDAISQWKEAFRLSSHPVFLYNIAQSHRRKEEFKLAIFFYKQFLQEDPKAANRATVEARISELETQLVGQQEVKDAQPQEPLATDTGSAAVGKTENIATPSPDPAVKEPTTDLPTEVASVETSMEVMPEVLVDDDRQSSTSNIRLAGVGTGAAGIVLVGVGVVFALKASSAASDVEAARANGTPWSDVLADRLNAGQQAALISKLTIGLGAAALVGGGVMYFLGSKPANEERESAGLQIVPAISSDDFSVSLGMEF